MAAIEGTGPVAGSWGYRPHLDGLRCVAVYLVVAFHSGADRLDGGFIGVDVFFVLSGYLVTRLLLDAAGGPDGTGRIGLGRFYARRMRRLLPAAAVNLTVTAIVFAAMASAAEMDAARGSMQAAALYVSNWWFIRESADYFGATIEASPVLHYWSLSVEEQYYLLWPLLLTGLLVVARRRGGSRRLIGGAVVLLGAASAIAALAIEPGDPSRAYFGTDTRAYQLLAGAALAVLPGIVFRARRLPQAARLLPIVSLLALGGLLLASTSWVDVTPVRRGVLAATLAVVLVVSLEAVAGGIGRRLLSLPPLVFLGRISYGTYLWHWIVVLVATRELELGPWPTFGVTVLVASGLAALSYELVEKPIRAKGFLDRVTGPVIAGGLAVSLLVGLVIVPAVLDDDAGTTDVAVDEPAGGTPVTVDWEAAQEDVPDFAGCEQSGSVLCPIVEGSGERVLLLGDSHAGMLVPPFEEVARRLDLELAGTFTLFCPWTRDLRYWLFSEDCFDQQAAAFDETLAAYDPDLVILVHRSVDDPLDPMPLIDREAGLLDPTPEREPLVAERVQAVLDQLRADGRDVLVVEPLPLSAPGVAAVPCLAEATFLEECRFVATPGPLPEEQAFRAADDADERIWSLDLDQAACPYLPICDPVVDGDVTYYDNTHLTGTYARTLADPIERFLLANGVVRG